MATSTPTWRAGGILALIGVVLYLATGVFPYLASGLVAPWWGLAVLYAGWLAGLWLTIGLFRRGSRWVVAMPLVSLAF